MWGYWDKVWFQTQHITGVDDQQNRCWNIVCRFIVRVLVLYRDLRSNPFCNPDLIVMTFIICLLECISCVVTEKDWIHDNVTSLLVQDVVLNEPCGERPSNSIKTETHLGSSVDCPGQYRFSKGNCDVRGHWRLTTFQDDIFISAHCHLLENTKRPPACQRQNNLFLWQH